MLRPSSVSCWRRKQSGRDSAPPQVPPSLLQQRDPTQAAVQRGEGKMTTIRMSGSTFSFAQRRPGNRAVRVVLKGGETVRIHPKVVSLAIFVSRFGQVGSGAKLSCGHSTKSPVHAPIMYIFFAVPVMPTGKITIYFIPLWRHFYCRLESVFIWCLR